MSKRKQTRTRPRPESAANRVARPGRTVTLDVREVEPGEYAATIRGDSSSLGRFVASALESGLKTLSGKPESPAWNPLKSITIDSSSVIGGVAHQGCSEHFANDLYMVEREERPDGVTWLSIKRTDKTRVREWRHLQQIKNELCGAEREAVEIFPRESRLVDMSDQYHLWVLPVGEEIAFGFQDGRNILSPAEARERSKRFGIPPIDQSDWRPGFTTGIDGFPEKLANVLSPQEREAIERRYQRDIGVDPILAKTAAGVIREAIEQHIAADARRAALSSPAGRAAVDRFDSEDDLDVALVAACLIAAGNEPLVPIPTDQTAWISHALHLARAAQDASEAAA